MRYSIIRATDYGRIRYYTSGLGASSKGKRTSGEVSYPRVRGQSGVCVCVLSVCGGRGGGQVRERERKRRSAMGHLPFYVRLLWPCYRASSQEKYLHFFFLSLKMTWINERVIFFPSSLPSAGCNVTKTLGWLGWRIHFSEKTQNRVKSSCGPRLFGQCMYNDSHGCVPVVMVRLIRNV